MIVGSRFILNGCHALKSGRPGDMLRTKAYDPKQSVERMPKSFERMLLGKHFDWFDQGKKEKDIFSGLRAS